MVIQSCEYFGHAGVVTAVCSNDNIPRWEKVTQVRCCLIIVLALATATNFALEATARTPNKVTANCDIFLVKAVIMQREREEKKGWVQEETRQDKGQEMGLLVRRWHLTEGCTVCLCLQEGFFPLTSSCVAAREITPPSLDVTSSTLFCITRQHISPREVGEVLTQVDI